MVVIFISAKSALNFYLTSILYYCLKMLWSLIWSTKFAVVFCSLRFDLFAARNYIETRDILIDMFNDGCLHELSNEKRREL